MDYSPPPPTRTSSTTATHSPAAVDSSATPPPSSSSGLSSGETAAVAVVVVIVVLGFAGVFVCLSKRRKRKQADGYYAGFAVPSYTPQHLSGEAPFLRPPSAPGSMNFSMGGAGGGAPGMSAPMSQGYGQPPWAAASANYSATTTGSQGPARSVAASSDLSVGNTKAFSFDELYDITGGFARENVLGEGGFGCVFKGTLGDGKVVAVKQLKDGGGQGEREFQAEVEIISRVHHRHLVSLVGYCIHGDQRLLVYEYVPNKTLELHLHGGNRPALDWQHRWRIALGSAKGLAYLHEDCDPKIIHRDIKAANILLDYNFEPKVSDFGLAKIQPADDTHVSTRVMGTFGYLAPEYATTGKVTDRSDVYSYGVVLLELITGRRPVLSSEPYNDETLVSWSRPRLTKALEEDILDGLVDPSMGANYDAVDMQRLIACAAAAVRHTARSRPRMSQIVRYLEGQLSVEALNAGVAPGQSEVMEDHAGEQLRRMRRLAFVPGTSTRGFMTENNMSSSYVSEPTSEYGLNPSSSSSDDADASEVSSVHRAASRPPTTATTGSSATGTGMEGQSSGEIGGAEGMSRRMRPGRGGA